MATTVTTATLSVAIAETLTLNNTVYDQTTTKSISGIGNVFKRIFSVPASTSVTLATFISTVTNNQFDVEDVKYIRVTNLDDTDALVLTKAFNSTSAATELKAGCSVAYFTPNGNGATSKAAITTTDDIETLFVHNSHGGNVLDVEVFIATA
jgi:hypothetical protein|tara:strand:+ start:2213 stop:2668 length:456 start_codon:yes stop_codon:yes gene_type:complete